MPDLDDVAQQVLGTNATSPWRWNENGRVLSWDDGPTIAFQAEIAAIYTRCAREIQTAPPLGSVVLLVTALRGNPTGTFSEERNAWIHVTLGVGIADAGPRKAAFDAWKALLGVAQKLERIPADVRRRPDAHETIAAAVFEGSGMPREPDVAHAMLAALERGLGESAFECEARSAFETWMLAIGRLSIGLSRFEPESLALRAQTSVDHLPEPPNVAVADAKSVRKLLDSLRDDPELAPIARIARDLLAGLHLPRPIADRTELPVGGVSDITNRGSIERLLTSELAHDDLTLAVRIASNEALYMRRELPPRLQGGSRTILIDVGIRTWGVPRVLNVAVALALAAGADRRARVEVRRTGANDVVPVDLTTRAGLIEVLAALEPAPHPALVLRRFLAANTDVSGPHEMFFITHDAVLRDAQMQDDLQSAREHELRTASVERDGTIVVDQLSPLGSKRLHESVVDVADLLRGARPRSTPRMTSQLIAEERELPAICAQKRFPLLLPYVTKDVRVCASALGWFGVTRHRRVIHWPKKSRGGREIAQYSANGSVKFIADGWHWTFEIVVLPTDSGYVWIQVDAEACTIRELRLRTSEPEPRFVMDGEFLCVIGKRSISIFIDSPEPISTVEVPAVLEHVSGPFFRRRDNPRMWARLVPVTAPRFEPLRVDQPDVVTLFDRPGHDGPWALATEPDRAFSTVTDTTLRLTGKAKLQPAVERVSMDGQRLVLHGTLHPRTLVDLQKGTTELVYSDEITRLEPDFSTTMRNGPLSKKVIAVGCTRSGGLALRMRRGSILGIRFVPGNANALELASFDAREKPDTWTALSSIKDLDPIESRGRSPLGAWASLDRRGLLHLRSAYPSEPEMTIALNRSGPIASWSSDGRMHGPPYFIDDEVSVGANETFERIGRMARGFL